MTFLSIFSLAPDPRAGSSVEPAAAKEFLGAASPKLPGEKTPVRLADAVPGSDKRGFKRQIHFAV